MKQPFEMTAFIINGWQDKASELATEIVGENRPYLIFDAHNDYLFGNRVEDYARSNLWPLVILSSVGIESLEHDLKKMLTVEGYSVYSVSVK